MITDDDAAPALSAGDVTVTEGNAGTVDAVFTVTLGAASGKTVTVDAATSDVSATQPADYAASGSVALSFSPGQTSKTVSVAVKGDTLDEDDETFHLDLSGAANATIGDGQGLGTITDDDATPTLSVGDVTVDPEGDAGTKTAMFSVTLSTASGRTVTVAAKTADGSAVQPGDYTSADVALTFTPGQTSKTVDVTVKGDLADELDEAFTLNLSGQANATLADATGIGSIIDDDGPSISIGDTVVDPEGTGGPRSASFTVTPSGASPQPFSVQAVTAAGTASAPADFTPGTATLDWAPGDSAPKTVVVAIVTDSIDEPDEAFTVQLQNAVRAKLGDASGSGVIVDDDGPPVASISDQTVTEGDSGTTAMTFTVALDGASGKQVTVGYATSDGSATAPGDYASASGTVTFAAGQTSRTFTVGVVGDTVVEPDETLTATLSAPGNATLGDATATGRIVNDDSTAPPAVVPVMSIAGTTVDPEGDSGTKDATFAVTLSTPTTVPVSVTFATADGSATAPGDYTAGSGTVAFAAGETAKAVVVPVRGDTLDEADETFTVGLSNPKGATLGTAAGTGRIMDDDQAPPSGGGPGTVDPDDLFCGRQHRGKCKGIPFKLTCHGPGNAVWTFAAYNPTPGRKGGASAPKQLRLGRIKRSAAAAGTVAVRFKLRGGKADRLRRTVERAGYDKLRATVVFTTPAGQRFTVARSARLRG